MGNLEMYGRFLTQKQEELCKQLVDEIKKFIKELKNRNNNYVLVSDKVIVDILIERVNKNKNNVVFASKLLEQLNNFNDLYRNCKEFFQEYDLEYNKIAQKLDDLYKVLSEILLKDHQKTENGWESLEH